ncbi:heavy-metal-associated domain-containing protein [Streptomyces sp. M10(2022)]
MSCCTPDNSCSTGAAQTGTTVVADSHTAVYAVAGTTCGHCKATLTREIDELDSVLAVEVDIDAGRVTVTTVGEPDDALIAATVDEAGYELTGRA